MQPTSPTTSSFAKNVGGLFPKQIQRAVPVYVAIILLLVFLNVDFGTSSKVSGVLKRELASTQSFLSTSHTASKFPKKIWQTWKVDPLNFEVKDKDTALTWTTKNTDHRYEVLTDNNDMYYVETHFGPEGFNRPDIVYMYRTLTAKIVKADLLRYLVMYAEGGIYADIDVEALRPIERFIPDRYNERDVDMVIGVEIDQPEYKDHPILGPKSQSFCQWTFMSKPGLPVMLKLIDNIVHWLNTVAKRQGVPISEIVLDFDEVISGTGPSAFTSAILSEMSKREGKPITWETFHAIPESKLVGGVLVLTVEAFAAGQGHSDSGNHNARTALVKHHYHASGWPSNHPRYKHPIHGEVEKCNWEFDCVHEWDMNMATWDSLSEEEKNHQLEEKAAIDAAKALGEAAPTTGPWQPASPDGEPIGGPWQA